MTSELALTRKTLRDRIVQGTVPSIQAIQVKGDFPFFGKYLCNAAVNNNDTRFPFSFLNTSKSDVSDVKTP